MIIKSQIILYMYDVLINGGSIKLNEIMEQFGISLRTFRRYIAEINAFLCNYYKNQSIVYDVILKTYMLKDNI